MRSRACLDTTHKRRQPSQSAYGIGKSRSQSNRKSNPRSGRPRLNHGSPGSDGRSIASAAKILFMMSSIGFIIQLKKVPIPLIMSMTENEILVQYKETIASPTFLATSTTAWAIACASRTNGFRTSHGTGRKKSDRRSVRQCGSDDCAAPASEVAMTPDAQAFTAGAFGAT